MRILFLFIFICIIICILLFGTSIFRVKKVEVEGSSYYSEAELVSQAGISDQMNILQVSKKRSSQQLLELPYIKAAEIEIMYPAGVKIIISERRPIGYVPYSGTYLSIDKTGQVIDQTQSQKVHNLPVIEGLKFDKFVLGEPIEVENEDVLIGLIEITALLEKYHLLDKKIKIDVGNPKQIRLYINSLDVIIGEINNLDKKIQWLCEIVEEYDMGILDLSNINEGQAIMSPLT